MRHQFQTLRIIYCFLLLTNTSIFLLWIINMGFGKDDGIFYEISDNKNLFKRNVIKHKCYQKQMSFFFQILKTIFPISHASIRT